MNKRSTRRYELKERARALEETRQRITEATVELHRTVGPAATRITDVAKRAGVQRPTVYNHFPNERELLSACSAHWRSLHPSPDPTAWVAIEDPGRRSRTALRELYAWYRETEPMTANVLRDAQVMPALNDLIQSGLGAYLDRVRSVITERPKHRGRRRDRVNAAAAVAIDFNTWKALKDLGDTAASELAARFIEAAADDI